MSIIPEIVPLLDPAFTSILIIARKERIVNLPSHHHAFSSLTQALSTHVLSRLEATASLELLSAELEAQWPVLRALSRSELEKLRAEVRGAVAETFRSRGNVGEVENLQAALTDLLDELLPLDLSSQPTTSAESGQPTTEDAAEPRVRHFHGWCQRCREPAVFHVTEVGSQENDSLHFCEVHLRGYLAACGGKRPDIR